MAANPRVSTAIAAGLVGLAGLAYVYDVKSNKKYHHIVLRDEETPNYSVKYKSIDVINFGVLGYCSYWVDMASPTNSVPPMYNVTKFSFLPIKIHHLPLKY